MTSAPALRPDAAWTRFVTMWGSLDELGQGRFADELPILLSAFVPDEHFDMVQVYARAAATLNPFWWDQASKIERTMLLKALDKHRHTEQAWWLTDGVTRIQQITDYLSGYEHPTVGPVRAAPRAWDSDFEAPLRAWADWAAAGRIWDEAPDLEALMVPMSVLLRAVPFAHPVQVMVLAASEWPVWLEAGIGSSRMARTAYRSAESLMSRAVWPSYLQAVFDDPEHFTQHIHRGMQEMTAPATIPDDPFRIDLAYLPPIVEGAIGEDLIALRFDTQVLIQCDESSITPESVKVHLNVDVGASEATIDHVEPRTGVEDIAVLRSEDQESESTRKSAAVRLGSIRSPAGATAGGDVSKGQTTRESIQTVQKVVRIKADVFERDAWWEFTPTPTFDLRGTHRLTIKMLAPRGVETATIRGSVEVTFAGGRVQRYEEDATKRLPNRTS